MDQAYDFSSVAHAGQLKLPSGEEYRVLRRVGERWLAARLTEDRLSANFQGSPLWPERVLSPYPNLSAYFGLGKSSESLCFIPSMETINGKLKALFGQSAFTFARVENLTESQYVDLFVRHRQLPMACDEDQDSVHDWSYHFVALLFQDFLENVRVAADFVREWARGRDHLVERTWNYYGHSLNSKGQFQSQYRVEKLPFSAAIDRQLAIAIDVATAKIVQILMLRTQGRTHAIQGELHQLDRFLKGIGRDAIDILIWLEPASERPYPCGPLGRQLESGGLSYFTKTLGRRKESWSGILAASLWPGKRLYDQIFSAFEPDRVTPAGFKNQL